MPKEVFSAEESLLVIQRMIDKTREGFSDKSHYFLLWGWAAVLGCLGQFVLKHILQNPHHYLTWLITFPALLIHFLFIRQDIRKQRVRTYVSESMSHLW